MISFGRNVTSNDDGCIAAVPGTDCSAAFQSHADWLYNNGGGGVLLIPRGNYKFSAAINLRGSVSLQGEFASTILEAIGDVTVIECNGSRHALRDLWVIGALSWYAVNPAVKIAQNRCVHMSDCILWHGGAALENHGNDGRFRDSFLWGHNSCMQNHGNNWYFGMKFDDCGMIGPNGQPWLTAYSIINGAGVTENYYFGCDMSGKFIWSFMANGCFGHFVKMIGCITSKPIDVTNNSWALFTGHTFGDTTFNAYGAAITIEESYKIGQPPLVPLGPALARLGWNTNYNI
jgi:hypothetical protein